jgi:hypothetical protein
MQRAATQKAPQARRAIGLADGSFSHRGFRRSDLEFRECDQGLVFVSAGFAFPDVAHAVLGQILGPFRHEERFAALSTGIREARIG